MLTLRLEVYTTFSKRPKTSPRLETVTIGVKVGQRFLAVQKAFPQHVPLFKANGQFLKIETEAEAADRNIKVKVTVYHFENDESRGSSDFHHES